MYKKVPATKNYYSRFNKTVIWEHPAETHVDDEKEEPNEKYWAWREKGMNNKYAVRYPVGFSMKNRSSCLYSIWEGKKYDYIEARKNIYMPVYINLVKKHEKFKKLKKMLADGTNLLIVEVDGPKEESLDYYKEKYGVADDFIVNSTIEVTEKNMEIMLNDPKHAFGHGYCLAIALLNE